MVIKVFISNWDYDVLTFLGKTEKLYFVANSKYNDQCFDSWSGRSAQYVLKESIKL